MNSYYKNSSQGKDLELQIKNYEAKLNSWAEENLKALNFTEEKQKTENNDRKQKTENNDRKQNNGIKTFLHTFTLQYENFKTRTLVDLSNRIQKLEQFEQEENESRDLLKQIQELEQIEQKENASIKFSFDELQKAEKAYDQYEKQMNEEKAKKEKDEKRAKDLSQEWTILNKNFQNEYKSYLKKTDELEKTYKKICLLNASYKYIQPKALVYAAENENHPYNLIRKIATMQDSTTENIEILKKYNETVKDTTTLLNTTLISQQNKLRIEEISSRKLKEVKEEKVNLRYIAKIKKAKKEMDEKKLIIIKPTVQKQKKVTTNLINEERKSEQKAIEKQNGIEQQKAIEPQQKIKEQQQAIEPQQKIKEQQQAIEPQQKIKEQQQAIESQQKIKEQQQTIKPQQKIKEQQNETKEQKTGIKDKKNGNFAKRFFKIPDHSMQEKYKKEQEEKNISEKMISEDVKACKILSEAFLSHVKGKNISTKEEKEVVVFMLQILLIEFALTRPLGKTQLQRRDFRNHTLYLLFFREDSIEKLIEALEEYNQKIPWDGGRPVYTEIESKVLGELQSQVYDIYNDKKLGSEVKKSHQRTYTELTCLQSAKRIESSHILNDDAKEFAKKKLDLLIEMHFSKAHARGFFPPAFWSTRSKKQENIHYRHRHTRFSTNSSIV